MNDSVSSKDALFMLDTSMEEEMASYGDEATGLVVKHINSTPELYNRIKDNKSIANISAKCYDWAEEHKNEFGELFITELDVVKWADVAKRV